MPNMIFVPGFAGVELFDGKTDALIWADRFNIMKFGLWPLRLASNGIAPAPAEPFDDRSAGRLLFARWRADTRSNVGQSYSGFINTLLRLEGWTTYGLPWDWRRGMNEAAQKLAGFVEVYGTTDKPVAIVAHSAGGLVARLAWQILGTRSLRPLVSRIILFNCPNFGTYKALELMRGNEPITTQVEQVRSQVAGALGQVRCDLADLVTIVSSFPALYQLLPFFGSADQVGDPLRTRIYDADRWQGKIDLHWLDDAADFFQPQFGSAETIPTFQVLTTVAGSGVDTFAALDNATSFPDRKYAYKPPVDGDGYAPVAQQLLDAGVRYTVPGDHNGVINSTIVSDKLSTWLTEQHHTIRLDPPDDTWLAPYSATVPQLPFGLDPVFRPIGRLNVAGDP